MTWLFTARERFGPDTHPEGWRGYLEFSGFRHIQELVSADSILCGDVITELVDEDWDHNVHADYRITLFTNFEYLARRTGVDLIKHNILGILERPTHENEKPPTDFEHCGFDILDSYDSVSVLTNCGKYPGIMDPQEVNQFGLLSNLVRANTIGAKIRTAFPDENHCRDCRVWSIARYMICK